MRLLNSSFPSPAQKKLLEKSKEKEADELKKFVSTSYQERLQNMNAKINSLPEINDIPKCSWTK